MSKLPYRIGVIGSGFISKSFVINVMNNVPDLTISKVLTRTNIKNRTDFPYHGLLTNSLDDVVKNSDIIFECSGDVEHTTECMLGLIDLNKEIPVVTMNIEFHVTVGRFFNNRLYITEANGDQPGVILTTIKELQNCGLKPYNCGIYKKYYNPAPTDEQILQYAKMYGLSTDKVRIFTNGTKITAEMIFICNNLKWILNSTRSISDSGLGSLHSVNWYTGSGKDAISVIYESDNSTLTKHLSYFNGGNVINEKYFRITKPHLCAFQAVETIKDIIYNKSKFLMQNTHNRYMLAAAATRSIKAGTVIGGNPFGHPSLNGLAAPGYINSLHVPLGLLQHATIINDIHPSTMLNVEDVELDSSKKCVKLWKLMTNG